MKRLLCIVCTFLLLFSLCACTKSDTKNDTTTNIKIDEGVELIFKKYDQNIQTLLPDEEAEKVICILDDKSYDPNYGIPSCSFDKDVSLKVGDSIYAIAQDTCNIIQDRNKLRYFSVTDDEMEYIHSLFEKYGGYFPCI